MFQPGIKVYLSLLVVFGSFLIPEHYLKHFHPHDHPSCSDHCSLDHDSFTEKYHDCDDEKEYFFSPVPEKIRLKKTVISVGSLPFLAIPASPLRFHPSIPPRSPPLS